MLFVDSNVAMYLVGSSHPLKEAARRLLESAAARDERLVTDAEVRRIATFDQGYDRWPGIERIG